MPKSKKEPTSSPIPGWLTTAQVTERTGWNQESVANYVRSGRLRGQKLGPIWLVEEASLEEYLSKNPKPGPKPKKK